MTTFDPARFSSPAEQAEWFETLARTVAVDFDGVIHPYTDGWVGAVPFDEPPTPGTREFLTALRAAGYRIVVFSTRCTLPEGLGGVWDWLHRHGLGDLVDEATCQKPAAVAYIDDRAIPFDATDPDAWDRARREVDRLAAGRPHGAARAE